MKPHDVCVRGAGIVGRSLALSLARLGLRVALVADASPPRGEDVRAYALNAASVGLLRELRVWDSLPAGAATAVHEMRIAGDASGLLEFSAWQQQVSELAWITDAARLELALDAAVRFAPHVTVVPAPVDAALTAICEGKASAGRDAVGVRFDRQDYGHRAIAARLDASLPHRHVAWQWFRSPDVLALLPFDTPTPERGFALVWSLPETRAQELLALDGAAFEAALNEATQGAAGRLSLAGERASWPLMQARASAWSGPGWVLLGDAAHVVHPLAGQGLNLGLGDVIALTDVIARRGAWRPGGGAPLLRRYGRARALPPRAVGRLTDGLWHVFAGPQAPLRELRNRGMGLVNQLPALKRWLTARALDS